MLLHILVLSSPNFRIHPSSDPESVPPWPEIPESFCASDSTASSVILTGIKIGVYSYVSNISQEGIVLLGYFSFKNYMTVLLIVSVQYAEKFQVAKLPPFLFHRLIIRLWAIFPSGQGSKTFDDVPP